MHEPFDIASDEAAYGEAVSGPAARDPRDRLLRRVVERHVLPRLALRVPALVRPPRFGDAISDQVPALTKFALDCDADRSRTVLHRLYEAGATFADLQLGLLAPAARRLDGLWRADEVSFMDVTLAAGSLQQMMRFVALDLAVAGQRPPLARSILVSPLPGEAHVFGAAMAAEFFRRDGWQVTYEPRPSWAGLAAGLERGWTDVLGLSITGRPDPVALNAAIARVRAASSNPDLLVIVGGESLVNDPTLVAAIGADASLAAISAAPARAHCLVSALLGARAGAERSRAS